MPTNDVTNPPGFNLPRSHFSVDSLASALSQTDDTQSSHTFSTVSSPSVPDEEVFPSDAESHGHAYTTDVYPTTTSLTAIGETSSFHGYGLPGIEGGSDLTLRKTMSPVADGKQPLGLALELGVAGLDLDMKAGDRTTFGAFDTECAGTRSPMQEFMREMNYLGDVIVGN